MPKQNPKTTVLFLLLANLVDLSSIAFIGSAGFLIIFAVVNLSSIKLSKEIGSKKNY
jgi:hypothetical protein